MNLTNFAQYGMIFFSFMQFSSIHLSVLIPSASKEAIDLISVCPAFEDALYLDELCDSDSLSVFWSAVRNILKCLVWMQLLCSWDPSKRPKADEALQHSFFQVTFLFFSAILMHRLNQNTM